MLEIQLEKQLLDKHFRNWSFRRKHDQTSIPCRHTHFSGEQHCWKVPTPKTKMVSIFEKKIRSENRARNYLYYFVAFSFDKWSPSDGDFDAFVCWHIAKYNSLEQHLFLVSLCTNQAIDWMFSLNRAQKSALSISRKLLMIRKILLAKRKRCHVTSSQRFYSSIKNPRLWSQV